jgi:hypothetical protein
MIRYLIYLPDFSGIFKDSLSLFQAIAFRFPSKSDDKLRGKHSNGKQCFENNPPLTSNNGFLCRLFYR